MPAIPAMTTPTSPLSAATIYDAATGGYFAPDNPPTSLEILNGGLDAAGNYTGGDVSLNAHVAQIGAFACGSYMGFDEWTFIYAMQLGDDVNGSPAGQDSSVRCTHHLLCADAFLPWNATRVFYWFDFFARQDATEWDSDGVQVSGPKEFYDYRFFIDETEVTAQYGRLPHTRSSVGSPDGTAEAFVDPGESTENRWRFHTRLGMIKSGSALNKGQHQFRISWWAKIGNTDPKLSKVLIPTGGMGLLALR